VRDKSSDLLCFKKLDLAVFLGNCRTQKRLFPVSGGNKPPGYLPGGNLVRQPTKKPTQNGSDFPMGDRNHFFAFDLFYPASYCVKLNFINDFQRML
jgi:hypothetical protein